MVTKRDDELTNFAARLNEALDEMEFFPKGKGRQVRLAEEFGISQKGARKWLEGESFPEIDKGIALAKMTGVRFEWLYTGNLPKREHYPKPEAQNHGMERTHVDTEDAEHLALAARLKEAICAAQSLADIADACGVDPQTVLEWLNTGRIDASHLEIISKLTGYNPHWIATGEGAKLVRNLIDRRIFENAVRYTEATIARLDYPLRFTDRIDCYWRVYQILLAKEHMTEENLDELIKSIVKA